MRSGSSPDTRTNIMNVIKHFLDSFETETKLDVKFFLYYNSLLAEHTGVSPDKPLVQTFLEYLQGKGLIMLEKDIDDNGSTKTLTARKVFNGN